MNVRPRILTPIGSEPVDREWAILRLVPGGDGLTRLADGRVAFASGALPGDRIRPLEVEDKRSYVRATRWELISPGPDRVAAACPVAERCGGCDWMTLSRPAELANKSRVLREALVRTGGFAELPLELPIVSAGEELRYRNRLRLHVDRAARIGLYARGSHELVEIPGCVVSNPAIDRTLERVRDAAKLEPASMHELAELEIRVSPGDGSVCVRLVPRERADVALLERLAAAIAANGEISAPIAGHGDASFEQKFPLSSELSLSVPVSAFTQVNWAVNLELVDAVVRGARERGCRRFLDLYAGSGNFSLPLLAAGIRGTAIEQTVEAIQSAERTARASGLAGGTFLAGDVGLRLRRLAQARERFDLILLDPPRSGARDVLPWVIELRPANIAICACDPVTLARDLKTLARAGWRLDDVVGFDMFPRTHHVEALAWMSLPPGSSRSGR